MNKKWFALITGIVAIVVVSLSLWWGQHQVPSWEELRLYAEKDFPAVGTVFFWQELDSTGYAVIHSEFEATDTYAHFLTWLIVNGRACGLERVVLIDSLEATGGGYVAVGYIQAVGEGLENWPHTAATDEGMGEWLDTQPYGTGAYVLPYSLRYAVSEDEKAFEDMLKISEYMNDHLVNR